MTLSLRALKGRGNYAKKVIARSLATKQSPWEDDEIATAQSASQRLRRISHIASLLAMTFYLMRLH